MGIETILFQLCSNFVKDWTTQSTHKALYGVLGATSPEPEVNTSMTTFFFFGFVTNTNSNKDTLESATKGATSLYFLILTNVFTCDLVSPAQYRKVLDSWSITNEVFLEKRGKTKKATQGGIASLEHEKSVEASSF